MLKHRLIFGIIMTLVFSGLILFDGWMDGSISDSIENRPVQGTLLCCLVAVLLVIGQFEISKLAKARELVIFKTYVIVFSIAIATAWYWPQIFNVSTEKYLALVCAFALCGLFFRNCLSFSTTNVFTNCGANLLAIFYFGIMACFVVAVRVELGLWHLFMFIFTVKLSDIGAYTFGSLWGKHKFSPKISPGKTWEGMAGAMIFAAVIAVLLAVIFGIMNWYFAVIFGAVFAFIGQFGDLAESMLKRDAQQKDSASSIPGFGGILDIVDSPLFAAPFAYLFFLLVN